MNHDPLLLTLLVVLILCWAAVCLSTMIAIQKLRDKLNRFDAKLAEHLSLDERYQHDRRMPPRRMPMRDVWRKEWNK